MPGNGKYDYYAFISYKRTDWKWAKWLRERLQSYRLPHSTSKRHNDSLTRRFNPVFLDKTNLTPGMLDEGLKSEVQASKYLIVICSRAAHNDSKYLDDEIGYYLEKGNLSGIIPFVIEDSDDPIKDTFPLRLQEEYEGSSEKPVCIKAVNRKREAFLELAAYMHGIDPSEMKKDDKRRFAFISTVAAICITALIGAVTFGVYSWKDYNAVKKTYYANYAERYGVPEGIGLLTDEEIKHMHEHYTIISSRGKVLELRHENSYGRLTGYEGSSYKNRPVSALYEYADGILTSVTYRDVNEKPRIIFDYTDDTLRTVNLIQYADKNDEEGYMRGAFLSMNTGSYQSDIYDPASTGGKSNIVRFIYDYDDDGYVKEMHYASDTRNNSPANDADGVAGFLYKRNARGQVIGEKYLYCEGEGYDAAQTDGYHKKSLRDGTYEKCCDYDENGDLTEEKYIDDKGRLVLSEKGYAGIRLSYDEKGNKTRESCYGTDGQPVINNAGCADTVWEYDDMGNTVKMSHYGTDGRLISINMGYAVSESVYDEQGNEIRESYYAADGQPVLIDEGYSSAEFKYDVQGREIMASMFATDGQPVLMKKGFAAYESVYDEYGNLIRQIFYGTDGKPVIIDEGYAILDMEYDEQGNIIRQSYCGTDGKPVDNGTHASVKRSYDDRGNMIMESFFGKDEEPVLNSYGFSFSRLEYNERGDVVRQSYYGVDGQPIRSIFGNASAEWEYDEKGREKRQSSFGPDGKPVLIDAGFASAEFEYNKMGYLSTESYYGTDGQPVIIKNGYASIKWKYDERGNIIAEYCLGTDGRPVISDLGYAFCDMLYDGDRLVKQTFYDADGNVLSER